MKAGDIKSQFNSLVVRLKKLMLPIVRHHVIIVLVLIAVVLMYAVVTVDQILNAPSSQDYRRERATESITTRFDEDTIERIEQLRNRGQNTSLELPSGRVNPFVE